MKRQQFEYEITDDIDNGPNDPSDEALDGTFFHQPKWFRVLKETYGYRFQTVTVFGDDKETVCRLSLCIVKGIFGTRLVSLPFSDYGGPVSRNLDLFRIGSALSEAIDSLATEHTARYVLFKSTSPRLAQILLSRGFKMIDNLGTYVVDLNRPFSEIESWFEGDVRRRVRKGAQDGLEILNERDEDSIEEFYKVYLGDMKRHGSPPHNRRYFKWIWRTFGQSGELRLVRCKYHGNAIGFALHLLHKHTALFYMGVWPGNARKMGVPAFLMANSIKSFSEDGYRVYDFGRTFCPSGEAAFKQSFGGNYRSQNSLVRIYDGDEFLEQSNWKYRTLSNVLRVTPLTLLGKIGPMLKQQLE